MKCRTDFVTNSSSSSFIVAVKESEAFAGVFGPYMREMFRQNATKFSLTPEQLAQLPKEEDFKDDDEWGFTDAIDYLYCTPEYVVARYAEAYRQAVNDGLTTYHFHISTEDEDGWLINMFSEMEDCDSLRIIGDPSI